MGGKQVEQLLGEQRRAEVMRRYIEGDVAALAYQGRNLTARSSRTSASRPSVRSRRLSSATTAEEIAR